ncbi:transcription initiation factor TFIID subunit 12-like [Anopheles maculipalpis]|uniref:transcription initiation factor TFIID subunit 12-like n=1 Tax=Anopheles maculipalpis TaxID=1496333 RepID=UPI0021597E4E|nr:transcription initiation factor TFIID subunit 12-like [Anopheles maculipalpis]
MSRFVQVLVAVTLVAGVLGQDTSNDASTVSPQDIYDLSDDDFKLWLSGRQPKAWEGDSASSSSSIVSTTTTTPRTTTPPSVFRTTTTTTTTTPTTPSFLTTTSQTISPNEPSPSDVKSWFEEEETVTSRPDVLGEQFKPAGEDFAQWLERQMNRVQEVTFVPQTTLTGDQLAGAGLVTRLTTIRNRIPATTFPPLPVTDFAPVPTTTPPAPAPSLASEYLPVAEQGTIAPAVAPGPLDLQQWLRDQLQTSQRLTDNLLAQWTPGGSIVRSDGHHYTPNAVSYQTSALVHGLQGVSHSGHVRNQPIPVAVHHSAPSIRRVFYPSGSFIYAQPQVPQYGSFVGSYKTPLVIKYH